MGRAGVSFALLLLISTPFVAGAAPPPCEARFLVQGDALFGGSPEVFDVDADGISILGHCYKKRARARLHPDGARLRVRFTTFCGPGRLCLAPGGLFGFLPIRGPRRIGLCDGLKDVRIQAVVDSACETLTGRLRARRPRLDREFVAVVSPLAPPECVDNGTGGGCHCGTLFGMGCAEGAFCETSGDLCGGEEVRVGLCIPAPEVCPDVWLPVCGCDGVSYGNDCERRAAAVSKLHDGACAELEESPAE